MDRENFLLARKKVGKTQKQLAGLLGSSIKAIQGYEQGWRAIPPCRAADFFPALPPEIREQCPAWEFQAGGLYWFINGTLCECKAQKKLEGRNEYL